MGWVKIKHNTCVFPSAGDIEQVHAGPGSIWRCAHDACDQHWKLVSHHPDLLAAKWVPVWWSNTKGRWTSVQPAAQREDPVEEYARPTPITPETKAAKR